MPDSLHAPDIAVSMKQEHALEHRRASTESSMKATLERSAAG